MDGFKVAQAIKLDPQSFVPIILLTARTDFETRRRGHLAGADDFLTKPVNPDELAIRIDAMLRIKELTEALEEAHRKLDELADTDGLTGVASRRRLEEVLDLEHERSRRYRRPLGVLIIDIDHFKRVNDTYGHLAGDAVLVKLSQIAMGALRQEDIFARYGGEEFAILCRGVKLQHAGVLGERLRGGVEAGVFEHEGRRMPVTISVRVASYPTSPVESPSQLIAAAANALYEATRCGRNRVLLQQS